MFRVGQNHIYTPYMTVHLVKSLPKIPYIHRIYMVLANPTHIVWIWRTQHIAPMGSCSAYSPYAILWGDLQRVSQPATIKPRQSIRCPDLLERIYLTTVHCSLHLCTQVVVKRRGVGFWNGEPSRSGNTLGKCQIHNQKSKQGWSQSRKRKTYIHAHAHAHSQHTHTHLHASAHSV